MSTQRDERELALIRDSGVKLSIVATLYKSEAYIAGFCDRVAAAAKTFTQDYEIVLVNDGSPDNSLQIAKQYVDHHANVKIIDLSRNFGHHQAMMTGLVHSRGDLVFLIDSDLEEEPEWLTSFQGVMEKSGADVVYGVQSRRRGGVLDRISGHLYYVVIRALSGLPIPFNHTTARLMTRRYVDALTSFEEREIDFTGLWVIAGFEQQACPVVKHDNSPTTYTLAHKIGLLIGSITSFSNRPLFAIFYLGTLLAMLAGIYALHLTVDRLFFDTPLDGWTSLMVSIWLIGGLIISFIGIIGIYLAKVFSETKRRPTTIVREIYPSSATQDYGNKAR